MLPFPRSFCPSLAALSLFLGTAQADTLPLVQLQSFPPVVTEGDLLNFDFRLSQPAPAGGLEVRMTLLRDTDPQPGDVEYFVAGSRNVTGFRLIRNADGSISDAVVSIAAGAKAARLVSKTVADEVAETEEHVVYALANNNAYAISDKKNRADFTISDFPVVGVHFEAPPPFREGTTMAIRFELSRPAPAGGLPVRLALLRDSDPQPGDVKYFIEGSENIVSNQVLEENGTIYHLLVTIAEGATSALLLSEVIADGVAEGPESAVFGLAVGPGYGIDSDHANLKVTITDP